MRDSDRAAGTVFWAGIKSDLTAGVGRRAVERFPKLEAVGEVTGEAILLRRRILREAWNSRSNNIGGEIASTSDVSSTEPSLLENEFDRRGDGGASERKRTCGLRPTDSPLLPRGSRDGARPYLLGPTEAPLLDTGSTDGARRLTGSTDGARLR